MTISSNFSPMYPGRSNFSGASKTPPNISMTPEEQAEALGIVQDSKEEPLAEDLLAQQVKLPATPGESSAQDTTASRALPPHPGYYLPPFVGPPEPVAPIKPKSGPKPGEGPLSEAKPPVPAYEGPIATEKLGGGDDAGTAQGSNIPATPPPAPVQTAEGKWIQQAPDGTYYFVPAPTTSSSPPTGR